MQENSVNREASEEQELKKLAPTLFGISRENSFRIPGDYFDSLNKQVIEQIQFLPDFESVSNENPFLVPEGYFNSLTIAIQQRITIREKHGIFARLRSEVFPAIPRFRLAPVLAFASVVLLLVFGIKYMTRTITIDDTLYSLNSETDLSSSEYLADVDENLLIEQLSDKALSETSSTDKSYEDYLINNDVDINTIAEQL